MSEKISPAELESNLNQFTGTENYYKNFLGLLYTDGVQYLAEKAGAYWLIDAIASYQRDKRVTEDEMLQEMQFWDLKRNPNGEGAKLILSRDKDDVVLTQEIESTDFPLESVRLYLANNVLHLPSEY